MQNAVERILELYRRSGRFARPSSRKIIKLDQNRVDLVFEINEGPLTKVGADRVHRQPGVQRQHAAQRDPDQGGGLVPLLSSSDDTYDPDRLAFDQELLRRFYLARGFADFACVSAVAELTPDGSDFFITFTLEEGPRYKFGKIDVQSPR